MHYISFFVKEKLSENSSKEVILPYFVLIQWFQIFMPVSKIQNLGEEIVNVYNKHLNSYRNLCILLEIQDQIGYNETTIEQRSGNYAVYYKRQKY